MSDDERIAKILTMTDEQAGPACTNVDVPPTIVMDDDYRESYVHGYRHALADVRASSEGSIFMSNEVLLRLWLLAMDQTACDCGLADCLVCSTASLRAELKKAAQPLVADVESLRAQLQAAEQEIARAKADGWCDACCGTGKPAAGVECICAGTGRASMAVTYLRERLLKAEQENERLKAGRDTWRRIAERIEHERRQEQDDLRKTVEAIEYWFGPQGRGVLALQQERDALRDILTACEASIRRMAMRLNEKPGNETTVALWLHLADKARALLAEPPK